LNSRRATICSTRPRIPTRRRCSNRCLASAGCAAGAGARSRARCRARWRHPPAACSTHAARRCRISAAPIRPRCCPRPAAPRRPRPAISRIEGVPRFILSRVAQTLLVLLVMSFVIYGLIGLMPGDPLDEMIASTPGATPEVIAHLRAIYGLDQPLMLRYWHWLLAALHGDFGFSRSHSQPVLEVLLPALGVTT